MIRNVIFDWSGTLVDDLPAVCEATRHVFEQAGVEPLTLPEFKARFRLPFTDFYEEHTPGISMDQLETWFHGRFREVQDSVVELKEARPFLDFCRENKLNMFVLSTLHGEHFEVQARKLGFEDYFDRLYVGVWDKKKRIHELLQENGLEPEETLFIGDMEHDIETAHHGGIRSCAVLTGYQSLSELRSVKPDIIVEHLGELKHRLSKSNLCLDGAKVVDQFPVTTVGGLVFDREGRVLMIQTHKWSHLWGMPGGKVRYGENLEAAFVREVKEETGLEVTGANFVMSQECIEPGEFYRPAHFILLTFRGDTIGGEVRLNGEGVDHRWVNPREAMEMPLNQPTRVLLERVLSDSSPESHSK